MSKSLPAVVADVFARRAQPHRRNRVALTKPSLAFRAPAVTVCIVNWNCRPLLAACLRSLLHQEQGIPLEVIVVDNASTDGAAEMVERDFPEARLIRNQVNSGFARANNQAAKEAQGQYLLFLNNDTVAPAFAVAKLAAYLENHPEAAVVGPRLRDENGKIQAAYRTQPTVATFLHRTLLLRWTGLFRSRYRAFRRHPFADLFPHSADVLMGAAVMLRRKTFDKLGGWDEAYTFGGEDMDLCFRAKQLGQVIHHPGVTIIHHGRASSRANPAFAAPHIAVGFLKYLRRTGSTRLSLWAYKLAQTLDVPLQFLIRSGEYGWRRLRGQRERATQTVNHLRALWAFARHGLVEFWRA